MVKGKPGDGEREAGKEGEEEDDDGGKGRREKWRWRGNCNVEWGFLPYFGIKCTVFFRLTPKSLTTLTTTNYIFVNAMKIRRKRALKIV